MPESGIPRACKETFLWDTLVLVSAPILFGSMVDSPTHHRYNDTPDDDWVIGQLERSPGFWLATGGSGHAFKVTLLVNQSFAKN